MKLLFTNLYPASRGPSIFQDKSGRLKERCRMRQNRNNTRTLNESSFETWKRGLEFWETSIFCIRHSKGFREMIYFSRNITMTTRTYSKSTGQLHLRFCFFLATNKTFEGVCSVLAGKKTTLHMQHTFFVHYFFAIVLHDNHVKLSETPELHVRICCMWSFFLFLVFAAAHFYLGVR